MTPPNSREWTVWTGKTALILAASPIIAYSLSNIAYWALLFQPITRSIVFASALVSALVLITLGFTRSPQYDRKVGLSAIAGITLLSILFASPVAGYFSGLGVLLILLMFILPLLILFDIALLKVFISRSLRGFVTTMVVSLFGITITVTGVLEGIFFTKWIFVTGFWLLALSSLPLLAVLIPRSIWGNVQRSFISTVAIWLSVLVFTGVLGIAIALYGYNRLCCIITPYFAQKLYYAGFSQ
jgi:hypothetical protein